jgi:hypothetical protein
VKDFENPWVFETGGVFSVSTRLEKLDWRTIIGQMRTGNGELERFLKLADSGYWVVDDMGRLFIRRKVNSNL